MTELNNFYAKQALDHNGHAACTVKTFPDLYKFMPEIGWMVYKDGYWHNKGADPSVTRAIKKVMRRREDMITNNENLEPKQKTAMRKFCKINYGTINGIKQLLKSFEEYEISIEDFDDYPTMLNCANGIVNLETSELIEHSPEYLFTYKLNTDYVPDKNYTKWLEFLTSLELDEEVIEYIKLVLGYCLTGKTSEEVMYYLYGPTRSGKGTFTNALLGLFEKMGIGINFRTFTVNRDGDTQNFDLAMLRNKRFVSASESKRNERVNSSVFKQVTGGDPVFAAKKGKDGFSFIPQWKVMLSSNFPLNADPTDSAIWARVRVIPFAKSFLGNEDKQLKHSMTSDDMKEQILAWAVSGAADWLEYGMETPDAISMATNQQRLQASSVLLFIDQCCTIDVDSRVDGKAMYASYVTWCNDEGYQPFGRKAFSQSMTMVGSHTAVRKNSDGKSTRYYTNITYNGTGLGSNNITTKIENGLF